MEGMRWLLAWMGMVCAAAVASEPAALVPTGEVQRHGIEFEEWIRQTFFDGYPAVGYTAKWDIPATANVRHGGIPVNPKAAKYGSAVGLGDALRQFDIDERFLLIVGYWDQETPETKRFVKVVAPVVEPAVWRRLWGGVTRADLERFDRLVKDRSLTAAEVQKRAREMKAQPPFNGSKIVLNPKIDAKGQRRLQCSLPFAVVFAELVPGTDPQRTATPELFGVPVPNPFRSGPRVFPGGPGETVSGAGSDDNPATP